MRKRVYTVLAALLIAVVGLALWQATREGDSGPVYKGKPLSCWIRSTGYARTARDMNVIQASELDSNAVPVLVNYMERPANPLGRRYFNAWWKMPRRLRGWLPRPFDGTQVRLIAMSVLNDLGPTAKPAIPAFIRILKGDKEPGLRAYAPFVLKQLVKEDAVVRAALVEALNDPDAGVRLNASHVLPEFADNYPLVVVGALTNQDSGVRAAAVSALWNSDLPRPEVAAAMSKCLTDPDYGVRQSTTNLFRRASLFRYLTNGPVP